MQSAIQKRKSYKNIEPFGVPRKGLRRPKNSKDVVKFLDSVPTPLSDCLVVRLCNDVYLTEEGFYNEEAEDCYGMSSVSSFKTLCLVRYIQSSNAVRVWCSGDREADFDKIRYVASRLETKGESRYKMLSDQMYKYVEYFETLGKQTDYVKLDSKPTDMRLMLAGQTNCDLHVVYKRIPGRPLDFSIESVVFTSTFFEKLKYDPETFCALAITKGLPSLVSQCSYIETMAGYIDGLLAPATAEGKEVEYKVLLRNGKGNPIEVTVKNYTSFVTDSNDVEYMVVDMTYISIVCAADRQIQNSVSTEDNHSIDSIEEGRPIKRKQRCMENGDLVSLYYHDSA